MMIREERWAGRCQPVGTDWRMAGDKQRDTLMVPLSPASPALLRGWVQCLQPFHRCVLVLLPQPAKHGPPRIVVERAENSLRSPCMAIEDTPSSQKPVQVAQQIVQALAGAVAPTESLDSFAQLLAALLWDEGHACHPPESAVMANAHLVPKEGEGPCHWGDEGLRFREIQSHLLLEQRGHGSLLLLRVLPRPFVLLRAGRSTDEKKEIIRVPNGENDSAPAAQVAFSGVGCPPFWPRGVAPGGRYPARPYLP